MGGVVKSGNYAHDVACALAEGVRQNAVAGLAMSAAGQAAFNAAEIAYCRAVIASCRANNNSQGMEAFMSALKALGTGGL
jgi:hypothetical protein